MPSSSRKQARTMAAAAHDPAFAQKMGIPMGVAQEFNQADAGGDMLGSGMMMPPKAMSKQKAMAHALRRRKK